MPSTREINGVGLGVVAAGLILGYAGLRNVPLVEALKALAMGKMPEPHDKPRWEDIAWSGAAELPGADRNPLVGTSGANILTIAASLKGRCYSFGGGHGGDPCAGCMDCSGYVSCVFKKAGLIKGAMATGAWASWGASVPFAQRQPGDLVIWNGGPGGGHMGIVIDAKTMWHNPCTGCGGVQKGSYGATRSGRPTIVRRSRAVASG